MNDVATNGFYAGARTYDEWLTIASTPKNKARFFSKTRREGECLLWTAGVDKDGYGKFVLSANSPKEEKTLRASRLAWELENGKCPDGYLVLHHCDNPRCVESTHLHAGTQKQNRIECKERGRTARGGSHGSVLHPNSTQRGEAHWRAKISRQTAVKILRVGELGLYTIRSIAAHFGTTVSTVSCLLRGVSWKCIKRNERGGPAE